MIKNFIKLETKDPTISKMQDGLDNVFKSIFISKIIDGNLIKNVRFTADQDTTISHGLGRRYEAWIIADTTEYAQFKRSSSINNNPETRIILKSSVDTIVSIWVF